MLLLLLGIGLTLYGLFILLSPHRYSEWLKQQAKLTKAEIAIKHLWQTRVRGIIYLVIGIIFIILGVIRL